MCEQFIKAKGSDYQKTLKSCIEKVVERLLGSETDLNRPGILIGKIQSGKTRAYIGIITEIGAFLRQRTDQSRSKLRLIKVWSFGHSTTGPEKISGLRPLVFE